MKFFSEKKKKNEYYMTNEKFCKLFKERWKEKGIKIPYNDVFQFSFFKFMVKLLKERERGEKRREEENLGRKRKR